MALRMSLEAETEREVHRKQEVMHAAIQGC